ncbi:preprotein translocase, SecG subunit [Chitinispirillum alkaliphilum]|nr:preprotein translocase, SecG subunit [Chitinispirillum alkaliphilum]
MLFFGILLFVFILVCFLLCVIVLIQSDKGGGLSGAIGGFGGAANYLGTQDTANILTRGTAIFAAAFLVLCVIMSFVVSNTGVSAERSLLQERAEQHQQFTPSSALEGRELPIPENEAEEDAAPLLPVEPAQSDEE